MSCVIVLSAFSLQKPFSRGFHSLSGQTQWIVVSALETCTLNHSNCSPVSFLFVERIFASSNKHPNGECECGE